MVLHSRLVAIVDDDPAVGRALGRLVRSLGFEVAVHACGETLLKAAEGAAPGHVLMDLHLPGLWGAPLISALRHKAPAARIVVMTGRDLPGAREACLRAGARAFILKPVLLSDLSPLLAAGATHPVEGEGHGG